MPELPTSELLLFIFSSIAYIAAAMVGIFQLLWTARLQRKLLMVLVCVAVLMQTAILILRAVAIKAIPLTGIFESMIVLSIVFALMYMFLSISIRQVWFSSVMVWVILLIVLIAGMVASPASKPYSMAATPWAVAHGISMVLSSASMTVALAAAILYLINRAKLKQKDPAKVLGKVPNMEKLEKMNTGSLEISFVLITFGLASGMGLAMINRAAIGLQIVDWFKDSKIVLIIAVWLLLGATLLLKKIFLIKGRGAAYLTIITFALVLFAFVGTTMFCGTMHDFVKNDTAKNVSQ